MMTRFNRTNNGQNDNSNGEIGFTKLDSIHTSISVNPSGSTLGNLFAEGELCVKKIAWQTAFEDEFYFSRLFPAKIKAGPQPMAWP